jgi:YggT family protein
MQSLIILFSQVINLYIWVIIISAVLSWLIAFNVVNLHNQFVYSVYTTLNRLVEPALRPIRSILPDLGGIDISPVILIFGLMFLRNFTIEMLRGSVY